MKIKCEQCKEKFDLNDTNGLCPHCSFYNTPANGSPDLDLSNENNYDIDTTPKTSTASTLIKRLLIAYFVCVIISFGFKLFTNLGTVSELIQSPTTSVPEAVAPIPATAPLIDDYVEEEVVYVEEVIENETPIFDLDVNDLEKTIEKCELPVNLVIEGTTVIGYTTTPNVISNLAILQEGITEIADYAFEGCDELEFLLLSDTVEKIGKYAFANLPNLKYVYLLSSNLKVIDDYAFYGVQASDVHIPETLEYIGDYAMYGMNVIEMLSPNTTLGINAIKHEYDKNLVENDMQITNGVLVKYIGEDTHIDIPVGVTQINTNAFMLSNAQTITLPDGLTYIGKNAFYGCNLTEISFPETLTIIDDYAFEFSKKLEKVEFNENLSIIGHKAFSECVNLSDLNIPKSLNYVTLDSFKYTIWEEKNKPTTDTDWIINDVLLECISKTTETLTIQDGVKYVASYSINCHIKTPTKIIFPKGTLGIQQYAINIPNQTPIKLQIPSTVEWIDDDLIPYSELDYNMIMIECEEGSYAHSYAVRTGIHYSFY